MLVSTVVRSLVQKKGEGKQICDFFLFSFSSSGIAHELLYLLDMKEKIKVSIMGDMYESP